MLKMIAWTYLSQERSVMLVPSCYCGPARPLAAVIDLPVAISQLGWTELFFVAPEVMVYRTNCRDVLLIDAEHAASDQIESCRETSSSFSKAPLQHIGHGALLRCDAERPQNWLNQTVGQQTLQTSIQLTKWSGVWYKNVSTDINTRHRWPEAAPHRPICLVWTETERRWQGNRSVARARPRACIRAKGKHFEHPTRPYIKSNKNLVETCFFRSLLKTAGS